MAMDGMGVQQKNSKRGQVLVEYLIVLLAVIVMLFILGVLLDVLNTSGKRSLDFISWKYP